MTQGDYIEGDDVQKFLDYKYVRLCQKLNNDLAKWSEGEKPEEPLMI